MEERKKKKTEPDLYIYYSTNRLESIYSLKDNK